MNKSVCTTLLIGLITLGMIGATTMIGVTNLISVAASSDEEIPCSPPVPDPNNPGMLVERCSGQECLVDAQTGERLSCSSSNEGVNKVCEKDELGRDRCIQIS